MSDRHRAELEPGTQVDSHGRCVCGRVIQMGVRPRRGLSQKEQGAWLDDRANWYWRHISDPASTMVPAALRAARILAVALLLLAGSAAPADASDVETGYASHYGPGTGVAMPFCTWTVRHTTGCGWVAITSLQTGIRVVTPVIDYCECVVPGSSQPYRLVDMQYDVVDALGLNWEAGLYQVSVERLHGPALPDTAVMP